jgi:pimeloyl-ACP methyl ester carboxylesterase
MPRPSLPPFQHRFIQLPDLRIHVAELDVPGKPMVLLHGIGMDWRVWQAISRRLAPDFHLYLMDLRGHGESAKPEHGYSLAHYAADVEELIDHLGLRAAVLLGSSLGGMVAIAAEVPPDVVSHRVLIDPPLTSGPVHDRAMLTEILHLKHGPPDELADYLQSYNPGAGRFLMTMMADMWHEAADGVIEDALDDPQYFAIDPVLRGDESQTLIIRADPSRGGVLSEAEAQHALDLLPRGSLVYLPGSGHAVHATHPAEFAGLVREFVRTGSVAAQQRLGAS